MKKSIIALFAAATMAAGVNAQDGEGGAGGGGDGGVKGGSSGGAKGSGATVCQSAFSPLRQALMSSVQWSGESVSRSAIRPET